MMSSLELVTAVTRMQEYIDAHIRDLITMKNLATVSGYSPWHAARLFKEVTGSTPFDYIRALRLTKAAYVLRDGDEKVIDVALDFVFDSHEGFTRAFTKEFGIPPKRYSQKKPPIRLFMPEKALHTYLSNHKGEKTMSSEKAKAIFVQVIERPARKVLLQRGKKADEYFGYCEEVGCDVWSILCSVKESLYEPIGMWLPKHLIKPGTSEYVQGVEVPLDYANVIPEGFDLIDLPPCTMMVFQGEPYDDELYQEAIREVWEFLDKFDPTLYGYAFAPQAAPRFQLAPMGYRGYIEARPVEKLNK
jgi:AraC family transcriptional regulator